ncbi:MAG: type II toxin-antitoxin system RelE/ParE family toxin [Chlorobi bacterium]|nr:type II toxin-antitoxin system RelE/ParE family toxin [Chlorobiota bacterium]
MEFTVFWTEFAKSKLDDIFEYYNFNISFSFASKLVTNIIDKTIILKKQHYIGQKEELLKDRPQGFRYLIYKNYKIIYWINSTKNRIEIVNIFDTRQNPQKIIK